MSLVWNFVFLGAGIATHAGYFRRGEHQLYLSLYLQTSLVTVILAVLVLYHGGRSLGDALLYAFQSILIYSVGVYSSLLVYRLLFHPLRSFPGPFGAKISSLWLCSQLKNEDAYRQMQFLHGQYGDFVRIGSSDLSIAHPKAVSAVYGPESKCTKAAWYDLTWPMVSLQTLRVKAVHNKRRRIWSTAFSDKALRDYEQRIHDYQHLLSKRIESYGGQPINVSKLFNLYTFDVMGDLAFGKSFNMLQTNEEHWAIKLLNEGLRPLAYMLPVWLFRLLTAVPGLTRDWWRFINFCAERMDERRKTKSVTADIMTTLLEPFAKREPTREELALLRGDSQLIVVAGSDTTASTLTHTILELCRNPEHTRKLREELAPFTANIDEPSLHQWISKLEHLNGVIWETLRLYPPVPTALQRKTPPDGIQIGDVYVPGNMTVWCPQYVIGRKEEVYTHAETFLPERWYLFEDMVKDKLAWAPFSTGPYGCIGRPLALMNLRTTLARLIMKYDFNFAADDLGGSPKFESETTEHFTLCPAKLEIEFKRRLQ